MLAKQHVPSVSFFTQVLYIRLVKYMMVMQQPTGWNKRGNAALQLPQLQFPVGGLHQMDLTVALTTALILLIPQAMLILQQKLNALFVF